MLVLAHLSHWNIRAEMWFGLTTLLVAVGALFLEHCRRFGLRWRAIFLFIPVAWLLFSLRQSQNLLWGWQLQVFMAATAGVLALLSLDRVGRWRLPAGIAWAVVSTFSFAAGFAVWPAGVVPLFTRLRGRARLWAILQWSIAALLVVAVYFHGYWKPGAHPSPAYVVGHPAPALRFLLIMLGAGLAQPADAATARVAGILLLLALASALLLLARGKGRRNEAVLGLGLVTFALTASVLTTVGRAGFGDRAEQETFALMSRYTTFTALGVYGVYRCSLALRGRIRWLLAGGLGGLMLLGSLAVVQPELVHGRDLRNAHRGLQEIVLRHRTASDQELGRLYIDTELVRSSAAFLEQEKLTVFSEPHPR